MGLLSREGTAPIADTETASGAEVEAEFAKLFNEVNGSLDNTNFASDADINGSKLANASLTGAKVTADTLTTAKMAASAVPTAYVAQDTSTADLVAGDEYASEGMTLSLSNLSIDDWIMVRFTGPYDAISTSEHLMTISIDDVDQANLCVFQVFTDQASETARFDWSFQATATTHTLVLKSLTTDGDGTATASWSGDQRTFSALVFPQK